MAHATPRYALINGREARLLEQVPHAFSDSSICIIEGPAGVRRYVSAAEWLAGAEEFSRFASEQQIVTSESPDQDKLALFKSLFRGRSDVYGHGFVKKDGSIGYSPACFHERTENCPRWTKTSPKIKCADCPARQFIPVNDRAIVDHFKGARSDLRDVMGLYVLTPECKTYLLVADFDKGDWRRETTLYRDACKHFGLFPAVERSRSGNGAHVWLFFDEPIEAEKARELGFAIISHAMSQADGMSFKSYDRLFPTQSTVAAGGFGNLIALPFQGKAQRISNSVFVDDDFIAYPDQWRFLSTIEKVPRQKVQTIVGSAADGPLGRLAFAPRAGSSGKRANSDSDAPAPVRLEPVGKGGFPKSVRVTKANMLYVEKHGLSSHAQDQVRRLAAFGNPEFFKTQAMHRSVRGIPRIIWCGDEDEQHIMLPRGCEQKLVTLLAEQACTCILDDRRSNGPAIMAEFVGTLRERQLAAAEALLKHENGILMAPTGFGKTVIGAYLIGQLKMRTLVIVPKAALIDQWKAAFERFLSIEDDRPPLLTKSGKPSKKNRPVIGQIGGGKTAPSGIVDVATFQSLSSKDDLGIQRAKPLVANYELVICDECHYGAAPNLELVMRSINAQRVYGLSATPKRSDGLERTIYMHCGLVRFKVDPKTQAAEQGFERILQPRFTRVRLAGLEPGSSFNQVLDALCSHGARNGMIVADAAEAARTGRTPIVLTSRKAHASDLAKRLEELGIRTFLLTGEGTQRERRRAMERVRAEARAGCAVVATGGYVGEGFDLPQLDTLMLASPYSWEGVITQYSGRLHRENEGKRDVIVYDYVDTSVPMLERMYKRRLMAYAKLGYTVAETPAATGPGARIVEARTWFDDFVSDLSGTEKRAVISAPYASPKLLQQLLPNLANAVARGIEAHVVLRLPISEVSAAAQHELAEKLSHVGCGVTLGDSPLTSIAVFDERIAWYGSLPLLAFPKEGECCLRIDSAEVASDLEEALRESFWDEEA